MQGFFEFFLGGGVIHLDLIKLETSTGILLTHKCIVLMLDMKAEHKTTLYNLHHIFNKIKYVVAYYMTYSGVTFKRTTQGIPIEHDL